MGYHSLKEWLDVFPKDLNISAVVKTYGQLSCVTGLQRLRNPDDEGDKKRLESKVYNIEYIPDYKIVFDTDFVRYYKDEKDDIITDLWEKLYCTDENAERMEKIFKYRSGITVKPEEKESKLKLDPRINRRFGPLTCFQTDEAKQFVGQRGYFTNNISAFENLDTPLLRILAQVSRDIDNYRCFHDPEGLSWEFFLPEAWVSDKSGEKFRAYSLKEFTEQHIIGEVVIFRKKGEVTEYHWQYAGFETHPDLVETMPGNGVIFLGPKCFRLSALFDDYEMLVWDTDNPDEKVWQPFGVKG